MRRVVITGTGMVSPLGGSTEVTWERLLAGAQCRRRNRGIRDGRPGGQDRLPHSGRRRQRRHVQSRRLYGAEGTAQGRSVHLPTPWRPPTRRSTDADWHPQSDEDQIATGVLIGSGIGGLQGIIDAGDTLRRARSAARVSPFFIPGRLINLAAGQVSIRHKLRGPNHSVVTACSTGAHAIGDASRLIMPG